MDLEQVYIYRKRPSGATNKREKPELTNNPKASNILTFARKKILNIGLTMISKGLWYFLVTEV